MNSRRPLLRATESTSAGMSLRHSSSRVISEKMITYASSLRPHAPLTAPSRGGHVVGSAVHV
eukprot:3154580-Rhodomonas_salina.1